MRLPKTIKIGGHQYRVIFPYIFTERNDRTGDCDFSGKIIRIVEAVGGGETVRFGYCNNPNP